MPPNKLMSSLINFGTLQSVIARSTSFDSSRSDYLRFRTPAARMIDLTARIP